MFRFEKLEVWQLSIDYGKDCYDIAKKFPEIEKFALADQLRRASVSISNNIAEGSFGSVPIFRKYLQTAIGSTLETINILTFAHKVGYISTQRLDEMYEESEKLIRKLIRFSNSLTRNSQ